MNKAIDLGDIKFAEKNNNYNKISRLIWECALDENKDYYIDGNLKDILRNLTYYFTGNNSKYDSKKMIWLVGDYGIGKSTVMYIFKEFVSKYLPFMGLGYVNYSLEYMYSYFKENGNLNVFGRRFKNGEYDKGKGAFHKSELIKNNMCIHEFGKDLKGNYYGDNFNQNINSLMMVRYELFKEKNIKTHITSNFHPDKIDNIDEAVVSRMVEMYNIIPLVGGSKRH